MLRRFFCKILLVAIVVFSLLAISSAVMAQGRSADAFERVKEAQEKHTDVLMAMDGIEGTAIGYNQNDRLAIKVFTDGPGVRGIPQTLDGVPVQVVVTGKFYALVKPTTPPGQAKKKEEKIDPTSRFPRPVPIGVSTGNENSVSAGTIGCRVTDGTNVYALSNNHVYADDNHEDNIGDNVLQPGRYDGGVVGPDNIGTLFNYVPIEFPDDPESDWEFWPNNFVDAAIATIETADFDEDGNTELAVGNATPSGGYGTPSSTTVSIDDVDVGLAVQKYGRTTGETYGVVTGINAALKIGYSSGTARFVNQIVITGTRGKFSNAGDSGSLIVTQSDNNPVGLLFAGGANLTIANPIDAVLTAFEVTIDDTP